MNPKGLVEVPRAVAGLFTASGYGYAEHMPFAYMHQFVMSILGQAYRIKGGYDSFWHKISTTLADVRCNTRVQSIQRRNNKIYISVVQGDSTSVLEFDKLIMSGNSSIPVNSNIYLSRAIKASLPGTLPKMVVFCRALFSCSLATVDATGSFEGHP